MEIMRNMTKQEFVASIRRNSSGFSRGASIYRGVTRHHQRGRWQARIGRVAKNKDLYLGTFSAEEAAAATYNVAAIKFRGSNAFTNFAHSRCNIEAIASCELSIGSPAKRKKRVLEANPCQLIACNGECITSKANANDDVETIANFGGGQPADAVARWIKSAIQVAASSVALENPSNGSRAQLLNYFELQSFYRNVANNGGEILQLTT